MARAISPERLRERDLERLTYDDIPTRLRPSAWRQWLDEVPRVPTTDDERDAAYRDHGWQPNPFASKSAQRRFKPGPPAPGWRGEVARAQQYEAYARWCYEHGLIDETGRIFPRWRWSAVKRWEQEQ